MRWSSRRVRDKQSDSLEESELLLDWQGPPGRLYSRKEILERWGNYDTFDKLIRKDLEVLKRNEKMRAFVTLYCVKIRHTGSAYDCPHARCVFTKKCKLCGQLIHETVKPPPKFCVEECNESDFAVRLVVWEEEFPNWESEEHESRSTIS